MDGFINRGSHFLLRASTLLESQSTLDSFVSWSFSFLQSLQTMMDSVINWLVSLISCLGAKINPILEKFTGYTFNVKDNSCDEVGIDGEMWLRVAGAVGVALVAIVVVWILWKMIMVIFGCFYRCCCCCCRRGRTMKAPGRNYRIFRDDFERNPRDYFRNLRNDQHACLV
ncbi:hypothetical protein V8G54_031169 [Vigna mungo]|uniref:Uncharacterized protein n=1 Tax=Vigna mungo TaxID=3915 RepID=A0AAQ3RKU5_VIGMU